MVGRFQAGQLQPRVNVSADVHLETDFVLPLNRGENDHVT